VGPLKYVINLNHRLYIVCWHVECVTWGEFCKPTIFEEIVGRRCSHVVKDKLATIWRAALLE